MARDRLGRWRCPLHAPRGTAWPGRDERYAEELTLRGQAFAESVLLDDVAKLDRCRIVGEPGGYVRVRAADGSFTLLPPRLDLVRHSPTGFAWGYGGSGPAQLALALAAFVASDEVALRAYHEVKWQLVAALPWRWEISAWLVLAVVKRALAEGGAA
jgi:hypothetical protein